MLDVFFSFNKKNDHAANNSEERTIVPVISSPENSSKTYS